jgi:hypothetical protein
MEKKKFKTITTLIETILDDLKTWGDRTKPWFRGESGDNISEFLCPKIAKYKHNHENHILQSFRRQAGGIANVPNRDDIDYWLMLAQHYGVPTRLLDWTEGMLHALYFSLNREEDNPTVYMLNPRKLNFLAGAKTYKLNYPLVELKNIAKPLTHYFRLAWENRFLGYVSQAGRYLRWLEKEFKNIDDNFMYELREYANKFPDIPEFPDDLSCYEGFEIREVNEIVREVASKAIGIKKEMCDKSNFQQLLALAHALPNYDMSIPIAFPATYQDQRMIAQRSCFTIHGTKLVSINNILQEKKVELKEYLFEYPIDSTKRAKLLNDLSVLGISAASIFPDLDHLAEDLRTDIDGYL